MFRRLLLMTRSLIVSLACMTAIVAAVGIAAVLPSGCTTVVNRFAFYPARGEYLRDSSLPPGVRHISFATSDGETVEGYVVAATTRPDRLVLYFHGNAGNIAQRVPELREMSARTGAAVFGCGYRGYGTSTGAPSEAGVYLDGEAALHHAREVLGYAPAQIVVLGRSLGSTVATHLAAQGDDFAGVILVTPLSTGRDFGRAHMGPVSALAGRSFDSLGRAPKITEPVLVMHGDADEVIPYENGQKLYAALPGPKRHVTIAGGHHNDLEFVDPQTYWTAFSAFVAAPAQAVAAK
ncbi:MAG: alpha/beta hydrolase [Opitutaceae bacterium]|nr:alpha/beta hydrolase [Opitutaceae bacterium]